MKNLERKQLYLDEETLKNIRSIKAERRRLGLTQERLAQRLGIPVETLRNYEYGANYPYLGTYLKLTEVFSWDISGSENYKYYEYFQQSKNRMKASKHIYGFSNRELGNYAGIGKSGVERVIARDARASVMSYALVKAVLTDEARRAGLRRCMR